MPLNRKRNSYNGHYHYGTLVEAVNAGFRRLLDHRVWKRHPHPFAKTTRGLARRSERKFKRHQREALFG